MMKLTLNALFDYVNDDGIFTYLNSFDVPWKSDVDADLLDLDYHSKRGTKVVSNTVVSLLDDDGLSAASKTKLAKLLYTKNKAKWDELWNSMGLYDDFDPLDNTNWTEEERLEHRGSDSRSQTIGQKQNTFVKGSQTNSASIGEQTITEGQQTITNGTHTDTHEEKRSAYNSSNYSPNVQNTDTIGQQQDTIGQKINTNGARSDSSTDGQRTDTQTEGSQSNSESGSNSYTDIHTITRSGNIGVTTSGQLIDDFRRVVNWQYFDIIFNDIDDVLTIDVFGRLDDDFDDYTITSAYKLPIASANVLGGIKVGQNLQIASDGTLKAVVESGVDSVNGKTGIVVLVPSDIGAASTSDISSLSDAINAIRQVPANGSTGQAVRKTSDGYDWGNIREVPVNGSTGQAVRKTSDGYDWGDIKEVPDGGITNQVLTKTANGYGWANAQGGGGISLPYTLVHGYLTLNQNNGTVDWTAYSDSETNKTHTYVFDVSQYVGHWCEFYFYAKQFPNYVNRQRMGFVPNIDLSVTQANVADSWCLGTSSEGTYYGPIIIGAGCNGWYTYNSAHRCSMRYGFNYYRGVIPAGMKYLLIYAYSSPSSVDIYDNDILCECKILD